MLEAYDIKSPLHDSIWEGFLSLKLCNPLEQNALHIIHRGVVLRMCEVLLKTP